jgi:hypothetical protein
LDALTDEERRALLGRLVRTIVVYDDRIEVRGLLPADGSTQLFGSCPRPEHLLDGGEGHGYTLMLARSGASR